MKLKSKLIKEAHKMAREIKEEFPGVDYKTQFGLCMSYLLSNREDIKLVDLKKEIRERVRYYSTLNGEEVEIYEDWYLEVINKHTFDNILLEKLSKEDQESVLKNSNIVETNKIADLCKEINKFNKEIGTPKITNLETKKMVNYYLKEIENYKDYNTWYNNDLVKIKNNLLMLKKFYENLTEKQFLDLEKLQKTNLGYKGSYGTVIEIYLKNGKYSSHRLTAFSFSLCQVKDYSTPWLDHVNEIDTVIEKQELDIINKNFDFTALERLTKKINNFKYDENATWETICIKSYKELIDLLKKLNIYEDYLKEEEQFKEDTELLNNPKLKEVKFAKYRSWETGGKFLIINEQVDKTTFAKLIKAGMYYHNYHADNEECFNGYCIEDTLENKIKLAKLGLKAK